MKTINVFILLLFCLMADIHAQDIVAGNLISVQINSNCQKINNRLFIYHYILFNKHNSQQKIWVFEIHTKVQRDSISKVSSLGWDYGIPTNESFGSVNWTSPEDDDLPADSSATDFKFLGNGLPGVVDAYTEGNHPPPCFPDGMATDIIPGYSDLTPYGPGVVGKTIGPINQRLVYILFPIVCILILKGMGIQSEIPLYS